MKTQFGFLIFCFVALCGFDQLASEPIRRYSYVGPFPRYPGNQPPTQPYYDDYDYDHLNNISLGRILQDDQQLLQQTENLSNQVKSSIANRLMSLANRLQHAASVIMQGDSRRRSHRPNSHRNKPGRYGPPPFQNGNNYNSPNYNSRPPNSPSNSPPRPNGPPRPMDDSQPSRFDPNNPNGPNGSNGQNGPNPSGYPSNSDLRNPSDQSSSPKPSAPEVISSDSETDPKSTPKSPSPFDMIPSTPKPLTLGDLLPGPPKSTTEEPDTPLGRSARKSDELDEKKKKDVDENQDGFVKRGKRDTEGRVHLLHQDPPPERPSFESVTRMQLVDVSTTVRNGYDDVIKLLKGK